MAAKILIVEDNAQNRLLMVDILTAHGFEVLEARDGKEGIASAKTNKPDLILLDMQMPVMDGLEAARLLKADPETASIKIVAVTSFAMKGDRERILAAGVDEYMAKPIDTRQLPLLIRRLLGLS
jgi:two-component system cell cycle response regulator DivK